MSRNGLSSLWRCLPIPSRISAHRKEKNDHEGQHTNGLHHVSIPIDEVEEYRQRGQAILRALLTPQAPAEAGAPVDGLLSNTNNNFPSSLISHPSSSSSSWKAATTAMDNTGMTTQHCRTVRAEGGNRVSNNRRQEYDVDWAAVIQKANEIQEKEKERIRRTRDENNSTTKSEKNSKILRLKKMKRALERRRKYDEDGSFSVNMLTYRTADDIQPAPLPIHQKLQADDHRDDDHQLVNNHRHRGHHNRHNASLSETSSQSTSTSLASAGRATVRIREDFEYESSC